MFFPIQLGIITPTDFHIFQRGWNHQPENMCSTFSECSPMENHPLTLMILRANPGIATAAHVLHDEWNSLRENPRGTMVFACFYHKVSQFPASFALVSKSNLQLFFWEDIFTSGLYSPFIIRLRLQEARPTRSELGNLVGAVHSYQYESAKQIDSHVVSRCIMLYFF